MRSGLVVFRWTMDALSLINYSKNCLATDHNLVS